MHPLLHHWKALLLTIAIVPLFSTAYVQHNFWPPNCSGVTSSQLSTTFSVKAGALISEFISDAGNGIKFRNATAGGVYAVFTCRPNSTAAECQSCLNIADWIKPACPDSGNGKWTCFSNGYAWSESCFVRYSSSGWPFSTDAEETGPMTNCVNATYINGPPPSVGPFFGPPTLRLLSALAARAAAGKPPSFDAEGRGDADVIRGVAQCAGDLSASTCRDCLAIGITELHATCGGKIRYTAGSYVSGGCRVAYSNMPPAEPPTAALGPSTGPWHNPKAVSNSPINRAGLHTSIMVTFPLFALVILM